MKESPYSVKEKFADRAKLAVKTLRDMEILNILFNEFPHPELIRHSYDIIRLLIICREFNRNDLTTILSCYLSKGKSRIL